MISHYHGEAGQLEATSMRHPIAETDIEQREKKAEWPQFQPHQRRTCGTGDRHRGAEIEVRIVRRHVRGGRVAEDRTAAPMFAEKVKVGGASAQIFNRPPGGKSSSARRSGCRGSGIFRNPEKNSKYRVTNARKLGIRGARANFSMRPDTFEFPSDTAVRNLYEIGLHLSFGSRADAGLLRLEAAQRPGADCPVTEGKAPGVGEHPVPAPLETASGPAFCGGGSSGRRIRPAGRATGFSARAIRRDAPVVGPDCAFQPNAVTGQDPTAARKQTP
jgi:hypothetical protein